MTEINVNFSYTVNLGNYESARIQIGLNRELVKEETKEMMIDKEFNFISNQVFDKIDELVDKEKEKR